MSAYLSNSKQSGTYILFSLSIQSLIHPSFYRTFTHAHTHRLRWMHLGQLEVQYLAQ